MSSTLRRSASLTGRRNVPPIPRRSADEMSAFEESMAHFREMIEVRHMHRTEEPMEVDDPDRDVLLVQSVEQHVKKNTKVHRTHEFDVTDALLNYGKECLVVRRGQVFDLTLNFNRPYDVNKDDLRFVFKFGKNPVPTNGTYVEFILSEKDEPKEWGGIIVSNQGNSLHVALVTPPSCYVGKWSLIIEVVKKMDTKEKVYIWRHQQPIYVLFNPWNKDDQVYMKEEDLLDEYVMNESGKIYSGTSYWISAKPWAFDQFDGVILDCCMYLLDTSALKDHQRGNPVLVSRVISAMVNAPDDGGLIIGNWSSNYSGGTSPLNWPGSKAIIEQFYQNKEPVRYGQCWVFSGLVTTVCRALGLPCRSVTNFDSAHDTDGSITIDYHFDESNKALKHLDDSVWNFHVWNDVWMARPDLPVGYGGWQAIDATPQETSDGVYCMGPMSVEAIRRGEVNLPFDGRFAFAEVNGDVVHWYLQQDGTYKVTKISHSEIGNKISTKRAMPKGNSGNIYYSEREDITRQYKFPNGSPEGLAAVRNANIHSHRPHKSREVYKADVQDVTFELVCEGNTFVGQPISAILKIKNESTEPRTLKGSISAATVFYTGIIDKTLAKKSLEGTVVEAGKDLTVPFLVEPTEYLGHLVDHCMYRLSCMCIVEETKQIFTKIDGMRLRKPHLTIKAPATAKVGQNFEVEVSFENPLPVTLTGAELRVAGPGMDKTALIDLRKNIVQPQQTFVKSFWMTPRKPGEREIIVYYNCDQIEAVTVSQWIVITE